GRRRGGGGGGVRAREGGGGALGGLGLSHMGRRRWPDFGGDSDTAGELRGGGAQRFLGIRYALVCWLDELFIVGTRWSARWNERKLEVALYGTHDRGWRVLGQARPAEGRGGRGAPA